MRAYEVFLLASPQKQPDIAIALFHTPYTDLREAVLSQCHAATVSAPLWYAAIEKAVQDPGTVRNPECCQSILVLMQRFDGVSASPEMLAFARAMLNGENSDVAYQAFCLLEYARCVDEKYVDYVRQCLDSDDEDFRIVAIQAAVRLRPGWGFDAVNALLEKSRGLERFHAKLACVKLCPDARRRQFADALLEDIGDARFSFAAMELIAQYASAVAVEPLLRLAKSFFGEPTLKVMAAFAAASLGSKEARALLEKFARAKKGNPGFASQCLQKLDAPKTPQDVRFD